MSRKLLLALFSVLSMFWLFVGIEIARRTAPNVGYNILWSLFLWGGLSVAFCLRFIRQGKVDIHGTIALAACLISVAGVIAVYYSNLLVPYEVWIHRGMPSKGLW